MLFYAIAIEAELQLFYEALRYFYSSLYLFYSSLRFYFGFIAL